MAEKEYLRNISQEYSIPEKLYFRIGDVAKIAGVKPYVLRYWEKEFPQISPSKASSKQRVYKREEVLLICFIRDLLHRRKFTLEGARKFLADLEKKSADSEANAELSTSQLNLQLMDQKALRESLLLARKKLLDLSRDLERL